MGVRFQTFQIPEPAQPQFLFWGNRRFAKAQQSLRYAFYDHNLTGSYHRLTRAVEWDRTKVRELGSAGWLTMSFGYWALFPAAGFAIARDPRYAAVFARCWQRWFEEFPTVATDRGLAGWGDFNTQDPSGIDIWMNVGRRALVFIDVLYSGLLAAVSTDLAFEVLKYLFFVCDLFRRLHLARPGPLAFRRGNHNLFDLGTVPFCLGVMFPEFEGSHLLVSGGRNVLRWHATDPDRGAIRSDYSSWEHSSRYGWYAAGMFRQALELARLNDVPLFTRRQECRVREFLEHFADLTAPDGMLIPYGDRQPPPRGCHLETARSLWSGTRSEHVARVLQAVTICHAPACRRAKAYNLPGLTRFFRDSGILVTRTGWQKNASLLFVTAEPRRERSGHSHHDFGSFQLWVEGVPLIYDAATWAYRIDEINPAERGYYYSAYSHNLLTIENY
ncbi:MAG: heparinase II/III domain-containing protein [Kiritimatiellia bacterium]